MAKSNFKKITSIKDTEDGNFGNYEEYKGGGTPRGGVWGGKNGRVGWEEREKSGELPQNAHRKDQPRTRDGKFSYNSLNGKATKYESRGKTVNPLLTGGENGIKIEDAKKQFAEKKGTLYDKYKDKWYQKGSKLVTKEGRKYKIKVSANDIWEIARVSFDLSKNAFTFEDENFEKTKAGRRTKADKETLQAARTNKGAQFVKTSNNAIAQTTGAKPGQKLSTGIPFTINPAVIANFRKKQAVLQGAGLQATPSAFNQPQAPAGQLKAGQKAGPTINPNILSNLANIAGQHLAIQVPLSQQPSNNNAKKISLGGFFKKP